MSIEDQALRRRFGAQDNSRDTSKGSDPRRSRDRSKTVLKSPASTVGTDGSMLTETSCKVKDEINIVMRIEFQLIKKV